MLFSSVTFSLQNATVKQTVTNSFKPYSRTKTLNLDFTYFTNLHRRSILGLHGLSDITAHPPSPPFGLGLLCGFPKLPTINTRTHSTLSSLFSLLSIYILIMFVYRCSTFRMYIFISTSMSFLHYLDNTHTRLCIYASQILDTICNYCRLCCFSCPITSPGDNLYIQTDCRKRLVTFAINTSLMDTHVTLTHCCEFPRLINTRISLQVEKKRWEKN